MDGVNDTKWGRQCGMMANGKKVLILFEEEVSDDVARKAGLAVGLVISGKISPDRPGKLDWLILLIFILSVVELIMTISGK